MPLSAQAKQKEFREDIPLFVRFFVDQPAKTHNRPVHEIQPEALV